ncbi:MAG TPA: methyltransferase domain-containing protein [Anaerolineae bacterium]|nr:methyltransferase domain-containing protein [Anaerolineae bacterium]
MDADDLRKAFDSKAQAWDDYTRTPMGRLREELTLRYLSRHLPDPARAPLVLDAGGGTGGLAIALARRGFRVHLLDAAPAMLDIARSRARPGDPIEYHAGPVEAVDRLFSPAFFDVVVCHTLVEYVHDPAVTIQQLCHVLKTGGLLSLEYVNRYADALRMALTKAQFSEARRAFDGAASQADLFGVPRRTFSQDEAHTMLSAAGVEPIAEYGVRIFADYLADGQWQTDETAYADLVALEEAASTRDPYRSIARYGLVVGRNRRRWTPPVSAPASGSGRRELWL